MSYIRDLRVTSKTVLCNVSHPAEYPMRSSLVMWWNYIHNGIMIWKHFPCYWSVVRGIHQSLHWSLVDSPDKVPVAQNLDVLILAWASLNKQSYLQTIKWSCWGFEKPWWPCDVTFSIMWLDKKQYFIAWQYLMQLSLCVFITVSGELKNTQIGNCSLFSFLKHIKNKFIG